MAEQDVEIRRNAKNNEKGKIVEAFQTAAVGREQVIRDKISNSCANALKRLPSINLMETHWNNTAKYFMTNLHKLIAEGTNARHDNWDGQRCRYFVTMLDIMSEALDVGWDLGFRDATGVVFQRKGTGDDPYGCGNKPNYPDGASCSLRCSWNGNGVCVE